MFEKGLNIVVRIAVSGVTSQNVYQQKWCASECGYVASKSIVC